MPSRDHPPLQVPTGRAPGHRCCRKRIGQRTALRSRSGRWRAPRSTSRASGPLRGRHGKPMRIVTVTGRSSKRGTWMQLWRWYGQEFASTSMRSRTASASVIHHIWQGSDRVESGRSGRRLTDSPTIILTHTRRHRRRATSPGARRGSWRDRGSATLTQAISPCPRCTPRGGCKVSTIWSTAGPVTCASSM